MNVFRDFEKKLESLFEGVLLRAFKSGVHPVEVGKKLTRELEGHKTIGVKHVYVPNRYEVGLSSKDYARFESYQAVMATELENLLISYIKEKGYAVLDRPRVRLTEQDRLREGEFFIKCGMEGDLPQEREHHEVEGGLVRRKHHRGPAVIELIDAGDVSPLYTLEEGSVQIGRTTSNDIVLPDPNVSRVHARIDKRGDAFFVTDLGSKNGTFLNEKRVSDAELVEGDMMRLGATRLVFRREED